MHCPKLRQQRSAWLSMVYALSVTGCNALFGLDPPQQRSDVPDARATTNGTWDSGHDASNAMDATSSIAHGKSDAGNATDASSLPPPLDASPSIITDAHPVDASYADAGYSDPVTSRDSALDAASKQPDAASPSSGDAGAADAAQVCATADGCTAAPQCPEGYFADEVTCTPRSCQGLAQTCGRDEIDDCCASLPVPEGYYFRGLTINYPAEIAAFKLDKYEVTVGRFRKFMDAYAEGWRPAEGAGAHPFIQHSGWDPSWNQYLPDSVLAIADELHCSAPQAIALDTWTTSGRNDTLPLNCMTWYHAFAFCTWDGGRLPTETEWEYAAGAGEEELTYPWGHEPEPNDDLALYGCAYEEGAENRCSVYGILPVGSKPLGVGKFGQLDLAGSMWEWVLDYYSDGGFDGPCDNCANLATEGNRVTRGGAYDGDASLLLTTFRSLNTPAYGGPSVGLRCARPL